VVADAIVHAAAHPVRDLVVGGSAKTLITVEKLAPRLVDAILGCVGYELQIPASASPQALPTTSTPRSPVTTPSRAASAE
jgi:hypothetical protein